MEKLNLRGLLLYAPFEKGVKRVKHKWTYQHLPSIQVVTNIPIRTTDSRALFYLESFFKGVANSNYHLVATFDSNTALRRRDTATNSTVYITGIPHLKLETQIASIAGTLRPHFDPSLKLPVDE